MDSHLKWGVRPRSTPMARLGPTAFAGALMGALVAALLNAPASWVGVAVAALSADRMQWSQASGTVWDGQATLTLGAGPDSLAQLALPQRLSWELRPFLGQGATLGLNLKLQHPAILPQAVQVRAHFGWKSVSVSVQPGLQGTSGPVLAQVPAAWLAGLGAPWNTLQPSGQVRVVFERFEWTQQDAAPPSVDMAVLIQLQNIASRVSTLPVLGNYDIDIRGGRDVTMTLKSRPGSALQLEGQGLWTPGRQVGFRGQASAAGGREEALSNLLNIIGRREGARSLIALGSSGAVGKPAAPTQ